MGQYIRVVSPSNLPSGTQWRGNGMAEVESGRGQYIQVPSPSDMPSGAQWRGDGWAEII